MSCDDIKSIKVTELKYQLTLRNLPITGSKTELREGLQEATANAGKMLLDSEDNTLSSLIKSEEFLDNSDELTNEIEFADLNANDSKSDKLTCKKCSKRLSKTFTLKRHYEQVHHIDMGLGSKRTKCAEKESDLIHTKDTIKLEEQIDFILLENGELPAESAVFPTERPIDEEISEEEEEEILDDRLVNQYYQYFKDLKKVQCLQCQKLFSGETLFVIRRHYEKVHNKKLPKPKKKLKVVYTHTNMNKNSFLKCCVGLMASGLPLDIFDDNNYFKPLLAPYERKFQTNINSQSILTLLETCANQIQNLIAKRVRNKMMSLKLDVAKKMNKKIILVNIQYIRDFKICVNTIGALKVRKGNKTTHLKEELMNCLRSFKIRTDQIYSTTIDYGLFITNRFSTWQDFEEQQEEEDSEIEEELDLDKNTKQLKENSFLTMLTSVLNANSCVPFILELAVNDVLTNIADKLNECRNSIKVLRKLLRAEDMQMTMPKLDKPKLWITTYEMINSLLLIRQQIEDIDFESCIIDWEFVVAFQIAFRPLTIFAKQLQSEKYIIGDFYRDWLCCEIELEEILKSSPYAKSLYESMQNHKKELLENKIILAALYVDPRFNNEKSLALSEEQKSTAVAHLVNTFETTLKIANDTCAQNPLQQSDPLNTSTANTSTDFPSSSQSAYAKLDQRLSEMAASAAKTEFKRSFRQKLMSLSSQSRVQFETNVLDFWKHTIIDSDIKKVVSIALTVPAKQISMQRAEKTLKTISTLKFDDPNINSTVLTKFNIQELNPPEVNLVDRFFN